jgi:methanogenic corrinoid protein MtbC1
VLQKKYSRHILFDMNGATDQTIHEFEQALLNLDQEGASKILRGPDEVLLPNARMEAIIVPALEHIGSEWEEGRLALSQVYMSGRQCEQIMNDLRSGADREDRPESRKIAIAVLEDYHLLGLRLVYSVLCASGYRLDNYGRQTVEDLAERVAAEKVDILLVSVLMLRSALRVRDLRAALDSAGCHAELIVGGAPFRLDSALWREVNADGTADSAAGAVALLNGLTRRGDSI